MITGLSRLAIYVGFGAMIVAGLQAPVARADSNDDAYVQTLNNDGIGHRASREQLIALGHAVCNDLSHGKSPVSEAMGLYNAADLSQHDAGMLVGAAIGAYCPQYQP
jgi:hypothetical protein